MTEHLGYEKAWLSRRWKPALNAFAITFADRFPAAERLGSTPVLKPGELRRDAGLMPITDAHIDIVDRASGALATETGELTSTWSSPHAATPFTRPIAP